MAESPVVKLAKKRVNSDDDDGQIGKRRKLSDVAGPSTQTLDDDGLCRILNLPVELIWKILEYLDVENLMDLLMTCNRFFEICSDPSLWKVVKITSVILTSRVFKQYMNFIGEHTEEIHIISHGYGEYRQRHLTFEDLYEIKIKCPNLKVLRIENQCLDVLEMFCSVFPHTLKELSLKNCHLLNDQQVSRFFGGMDTYFLDIERLILTDCLWVTAHSIMVISKLPKLKYLDVEGCLQLNSFLPYLSLSTRYGFKNLEVCNIRKTYINDSEASCFNYCKQLRELYFQAPDKSFVLPEYKPTPKENILITRGTVRCELEKLRMILPILQAKLDTVEEADTRMKILSNNFSLIMQDLGKCYTKLNFHRLFLSLSRLQILVDFERGVIVDDFIRNLDFNKFDVQLRWENLILNGIHGRKSITTLNSVTEEKFGELHRRHTLFFSDILSSNDKANELHVSRTDYVPLKSEEFHNKCPPYEDKILCIKCDQTEAGFSVDQPEDAVLDREFIQIIRRLTNQSGDFDYEYYEVADLDVHGCRSGWGRSHVVVAITSNPDGGPPLAVQVPDNECIRRHQSRRLELPDLHAITGISDRTVRSLFHPRSDCVKIEKISFRNYRQITNESLRHLGIAKQDLKYIDLVGTSVTNITSLRDYKPSCVVNAKSKSRRVES